LPLALSCWSIQSKAAAAEALTATFDAGIEVKILFNLIISTPIHGVAFHGGNRFCHTAPVLLPKFVKFFLQSEFCQLSPKDLPGNSQVPAIFLGDLSDNSSNARHNVCRIRLF